MLAGFGAAGVLPGTSELYPSDCRNWTDGATGTPAAIYQGAVYGAFTPGGGISQV